jgi:hypothetical protein
MAHIRAADDFRAIRAREVELALVLSDSTHADQRRGPSHTPNDAARFCCFGRERIRCYSIVSGIQIR